jgi:hypothetical protein
LTYFTFLDIIFLNGFEDLMIGSRNCRLWAEGGEGCPETGTTSRLCLNRRGSDNNY